MAGFSEQERQLYADLLAAGINQLNLQLGEKQQAQLLDYLELLVKWNQVFNLSGVKQPESMLRIHLLDSLSIVPFISQSPVLDVGSGAGLPGIPLAIALPEVSFSLLDSNGKKTRFMFQTITSLNLGNVDVIHARVEKYRESTPYKIILSRAYTSLQAFAEQTRHLLGESGKLLAMKGQYPRTELDQLPDDFTLLKAHKLNIPGEPGVRHLIELGRA